MGTDIRKMSPETLSIYSNPAIIALNQDPAVSAGIRVWRYYVDDIDQYGQGEISLWRRTLSNGDVAVALVNAGNETREMNATLGDIFLDSGSTRSPRAMETWDVYDLWANRMDDATASSIITGNATVNGTVMETRNSTTKYNSTAMSYADGLAMNHPALFGRKTGTIVPMGTLRATVPRHGIGLFRIRSQGGAGARKRDEL
ncbi:MAG: hypothetical protein Q9187_002386 [Circinaria calcarea]